MLRTRSLPLLLAVLVAAAVRLVHGEEPPGLDAATREALANTLRSVLVEAIPERIEEKKDWGATTDGISGLTWRMDGLKLDVTKRTKPINHGLWRMATVVPIDPQKNLRFQIVSAQPTGPRGFAFRILVAAPLQVEARIERWRQGVKLLNTSTEASATVEMQLDGELEYRFDVDERGTRLVLAPRATAVDLRLTEFDWRKLGKLRGDVVEEIGDVFTKPIADQLDKQEPKALEKITKAIAKRQDKMQVPLSNVLDLSRWSIVDGVPSWAKP